MRLSKSGNSVALSLDWPNLCRSVRPPRPRRPIPGDGRQAVGGSAALILFFLRCGRRVVGVSLASNGCACSIAARKPSSIQHVDHVLLRPARGRQCAFSAGYIRAKKIVRTFGSVTRLWASQPYAWGAGDVSHDDSCVTTTVDDELERSRRAKHLQQTCSWLLHSPLVPNSCGSRNQSRWG